MKATTSLQEVNIYELLSEIVYDNQGNLSNVVDAVYETFLKGVLDGQRGVTKVILDASDNEEYHYENDGFEGVGKTPSDAVANLIENMAAGLYAYENGRP